MVRMFLVLIFLAFYGPSQAFDFVSNKDKTLVCDSEMDCHPGIARITATESYGLGDTSTAFLIAPNRILTASHALHNIDFCSENMTITFPRTKSFSQESARCVKVTLMNRASETGTLLDSDYAVIELDHKIARPVFELSDEGLNDEEQVQVYAVSPPESFRRMGKMEKYQCRVERKRFTNQFSTNVNPEYYSLPSSPFIIFSGGEKCQIKKGNSGAPIVDLNGKVRGVVRASESKFLFAIGTSVSCMSASILGQSFAVKPECEILNNQPPDLLGN